MRGRKGQTQGEGKREAGSTEGSPVDSACNPEIGPIKNQKMAHQIPSIIRELVVEICQVSSDNAVIGPSVDQESMIVGDSFDLYQLDVDTVTTILFLMGSNITDGAGITVQYIVIKILPMESTFLNF